MSFQRLRTDFQFAIFVLFCVVAILGVGPFAVYRFVQGAMLPAVVDTLVVASLAAALVHVWRGGDVARASLLVVATTTAGCIVIGRLIGLSGALWSFPAIISNFLLVPRGLALGASALVIVGLAVEGSAFGSLHERLMYFAAASVACLLAYVFAHQTHVQQRQLETLASRDPLTGVANRRAMKRELLIAAEGYRRHRLPVGLAVMDLDHFKRINDEAGHEAGDQVLRSFAELVQSRCRAGDRLFRYGGEEFVLLATGTDAAGLQRLVDDLRRAVAGNLRFGDRPVTVSIGGAVLQPGEDVHASLARADAAMYEAKHRGRDRAVVADVPAEAARAAR
ncbi:MAG: diguanylate cyclase [Pseudomonadota bacterium]